MMDSKTLLDIDRGLPEAGQREESALGAPYQVWPIRQYNELHLDGPILNHSFVRIGVLMTTRLALLDYCSRHRLHDDDVQALWRLGEFDRPPAGLARHTRRGTAVAGALLLGLGLVCSIAANWGSVSRALQFGTLEALVVVLCVGAALLPAARIACAVLAFIAIGALLAFFGQTYQTGADPWQLFAWWSVLGMPLVLMVRSDTMRIPWVIVTMTSIYLWTNVGHRIFNPSPLGFDMTMGSCAALLLSFLFSRRICAVTGVGVYTSGTALIAALSIAGIAIFRSFLGGNIDPGCLCLCVGIGATAAFYCTERGYDIFGLCACALVINILLVTLAALMLEHLRIELLEEISVIALIACVALGASVSAILNIMKRHMKRKVTA